MVGQVLILSPGFPGAANCDRLVLFPHQLRCSVRVHAQVSSLLLSQQFTTKFDITQPAKPQPGC